jgi:hypothetical protein
VLNLVETLFPIGARLVAPPLHVQKAALVMAGDVS